MIRETEHVRIYGRLLGSDEVAKIAKGTRAAFLVPMQKRTPQQDAELFDFATDADNSQRAEIKIMQSMLEKEFPKEKQ